ncbi:MAG: hypothetical protein AAGH68_16665, partial [Pseudomonadota bacterium]
MKPNILTTAMAVLLATPALAEESYPRFSAGFELEVQSDQTFSSTDPAAEINNTTATIEAGLSFEITSSTSLNSTILFEQVLDPTDDSFFEDHGLYVEELFLAHEVEGVTLTLGKFNVAFGSEIPGLYGDTFTEDYEINEKLGGSIGIPF